MHIEQTHQTVSLGWISTFSFKNGQMEQCQVPWYLRSFKSKYVSRYLASIPGQILSYHFLFFIFFFSRVNRSSLHNKHLIVYSYSGLYFCELFLHLWGGTDDVKTCSPKLGVLWWGGEKGVKWTTFAWYTAWLIAHTDWMCSAFHTWEQNTTWR